MISSARHRNKLFDRLGETTCRFDYNDKESYGFVAQSSMQIARDETSVSLGGLTGLQRPIMMSLRMLWVTCNNNDEEESYDLLWLRCPAFDADRQRLDLGASIDELVGLPARAQALLRIILRHLG